MHLILTGATGLVGSGVLDAMLKMKDVTKISIIGRRSVAMADKISTAYGANHSGFTSGDASLTYPLSSLRGDADAECSLSLLNIVSVAAPRSLHALATHFEFEPAPQSGSGSAGCEDGALLLV